MNEQIKTLKHEKKLITQSVKVIKKQQKKKSTKVLNQKVKRKEDTISKLKEQLNSSDVSLDLAQTKKALSSAEKKHKKLKKYHREKKKDTEKRLVEQHERVTARLSEKLNARDEELMNVENEKMELEEELKDVRDTVKTTKSDGKTYSPLMRMMVFDAIANQVPTANVKPLIEKFSKRCGLTLENVPSRTAVECMARELGAVAEIQTAEAISANPNCTLGFDATTQEGAHINSIHVTTVSHCYSVAVDQLAGGTRHDYSAHIEDAINNTAAAYAYVNDTDFHVIKKKLIANITNTMTDRCSANHATIEVLNESWQKTLNELNCHLHPLDSIATKVRESLRKYEQEKSIKGKIFGSECLAANIVLQLNKMRYKDGKGDPRGFVLFLDAEGLPRGILPRYRGNRLHVLFHTAGVLVEHYPLFVKFLQSGTSCGGLRSSIRDDLQTTEAHVELQVLGLIGKLITGPWMTKFYTSASNQIQHVEGIKVVRELLERLKEQVALPVNLLSCPNDLFGNALNQKPDSTLLKLKEAPKDQTMFATMMQTCLTAIIDVLERQYSKYFECDITEKLKEETKSARSHNIDAEEMVGMFSAMQKKAPNETLCYISSKLRAQKNKTVDYLDSLDEEKRDALLRKVVKLGRQERKKRRVQQKDLMAEMTRRDAEKQRTKDATERRKVERKLKNTEVGKLEEEFAEIGEDRVEILVELMSGKAVGREICHVWLEEGKRVLYHGRIEKIKKDGKTYVVAYWGLGEEDDSAVDYNMRMQELAADYLCGDLTI